MLLHQAVGCGSSCSLVQDYENCVSKSVWRFTNSSEYARSLISLRHAIQAGLFRDGSGVQGAPATAVASGCLSLLADAAHQGNSNNLDEYFAMLDPISGHPMLLVIAKNDGVLARMERRLTIRRGQRTAEHRRERRGGNNRAGPPSRSPPGKDVRRSPEGWSSGSRSDNSGARQLGGTSSTSSSAGRAPEGRSSQAGR